MSEEYKAPEERRAWSWHVTDEVHDDAGGAGIAWQCPDCHSELVWAPAMWWDLECRCKNRRWDLDLKITYSDPQPPTTAATAPPARRQPDPIPLSERKPGPEDCNELNLCWFWLPDINGHEDLGDWQLQDRGWATDPDTDYTHWQPFHAISRPS